MNPLEELQAKALRFKARIDELSAKKNATPSDLAEMAAIAAEVQEIRKHLQALLPIVREHKRREVAALKDAN